MTENLSRYHVSLGAAYLDVHRPGWYKQIDLDTLRLNDGNYCIVGQLEPAVCFSRAVDMIFEDSPDTSNFFRGEYFGVDIIRGQTFDKLQDAWVDEILARRAQDIQDAQDEQLPFPNAELVLA